MKRMNFLNECKNDMFCMSLPLDQDSIWENSDEWYRFFSPMKCLQC